VALHALMRRRNNSRFVSRQRPQDQATTHIPRMRSHRWLSILALPALAFVSAPAAGQLRPFGPVDWDMFNESYEFTVGVGLGSIRDQELSLAGTRGNLTEYGNFRVGWRSGRIGVEIAGTLFRRFEDETVVRPPALGADPPTGSVRTDAGDILASTVVRLNELQKPMAFALRFATRLPTTSDEAGIERDRTDFFATVGARWRVGPFAVGGEGGVGILGTRVDGLDQLDVLTYAFGLEWRIGPVVSHGVLVGQDDVHKRVIRGNEDLSELRFGLRAGDGLWVSATAVKGIADFSPGHGLQLMVGLRR
jgi:hypothetical protein